jgi:flagellar M-ring protein FliF
VKSDQTTFGKGAVTSEQDTDEKYTGGGGQGMTSVAGASSNTPGGSAPSYPSSGPTGKTGTYADDKGETNYNNDRTETQTEQAQGSIARLAVSVLIDSTLPTSTVQTIQNYLSTLCCVTPGDLTRQVSVQQIPFSNVIASEQTAEQTKATGAERQTDLLKAAAVIAFVGALLFIFVRSSKSSAIATTRGELEAPQQHEFVLTGDHSENMLSEGPVRLEDVLDEMPEPERKPRRRQAVPEISEHQDVKLESIRDMIHNQPTSVALLLKGWMSDDGGSS